METDEIICYSFQMLDRYIPLFPTKDWGKINECYPVLSDSLETQL